MDEGDLYRLIKNKMCIPARGDRFDRIENSVGDGMPDINCTLERVDVWIEAKYSIIPKRPTSRLLCGRNHELLLSQANWVLRHARAGGKSWLVIRADDNLLSIRITDWSEPEQVNQMCYQELLDASMCAIPVKSGGSPESWMRMRQCLIKNSR